MAITIPTTEPAKVTAGDTITWKKSLGDYLPSDDWVLSYALVKDSYLIAITASDSSDDHLVSVSPATSAAYNPGIYHYHAYVTNTGTSARYKINTGTIEVLPNFATMETGHDDRSHVKKTLDALEATIYSKASKDQLSYSIAGRTLSRMSPGELLDWYDRYKAKYQQELKQNRIDAGLSSGSTIKVRFV